MHVRAIHEREKIRVEVVESQVAETGKEVKHVEEIACIISEGPYLMYDELFKCKCRLGESG